MPLQEVLILALTQMRSGICVAGFTRDPDPVTGLRWVRPVRDFECVLPGDMTAAAGREFQCDDVIALNLLVPHPDPPHVEDWRADFVHPRPRWLRRLEGERRTEFFAAHLDPAPQDVLIHQTRSLCLVQPEQVWAEFSLDAYSGKYEARMGFTLSGVPNHARASSRHGVAVTDLAWRDLGRTWLDARGGQLSLDQPALLARLNAQTLYLAVGLSRSWQGEYWPLVVGVHTVPDWRVRSEE
ncbi:MAG TPA: hypothetical protein PKH77_09445 [Anaerolineae bacterium]|nr:hypothetical protein [Anaerolineae bacterium]